MSADPRYAFRSLATEDPDKIVRLASADLARSGLDLGDMKALRVRNLTTAETHRRYRHYLLPSYIIPYFDLDGSPLRAASDGGEVYHRIRYLGDPSPEELRRLNDKKARRYIQPAGVAPEPYLPPLGGVDWAAVAADPTVRLIVTEGEKKAAKATKEGFPTIGLGGVWNFRTKAHGQLLLPRLAAFRWYSRTVVVIYDSDTESNPDVCAAMNELAERLFSHGADVRVVFLPSGREPKTGLDDFLVADGAPALARLLAPPNPIPLTATRDLFRLNRQYAYVTEIDAVVETATATPFSVKHFLSAERSRGVHYFVKDGAPVIKEVQSAAVWNEHPHRAAVRRIVYRPGVSKRSIFTEDGDLVYNAWSGNIESKRNDKLRDMFLTLFNSVTSTLSPPLKKWFLQWVAYQIQHPGVKLYSSVLLVGRLEGTGKGLLGLTIGETFGARNYSAIKPGQLTGRFNYAWAFAKQFVVGNELTAGGDKRLQFDDFKESITQTKIWIEKKNIDAWQMDDCINYYLTSNHPNALPMSNTDRRFFIVEVISKLDDAFYARYDEALWRGELAAAVRYYFEKEVDVTGFNPRGKAPVTEAKKTMTELNSGVFANFLADVLADPEEAAHPMFDRDILTVNELREWCALVKNIRDDDVRRELGSAQRSGNDLADAGIQKILDVQIRVEGRHRDRYYAWRNRDHWHGLGTHTYDAARKYLEEKFNAPPKSPAKKRKKY